jgi:hypothetical protein
VPRLTLVGTGHPNRGVLSLDTVLNTLLTEYEVSPGLPFIAWLTQLAQDRGELFRHPFGDGVGIHRLQRATE